MDKTIRFVQTCVIESPNKMTFGQMTGTNLDMIKYVFQSANERKTGKAGHVEILQLRRTTPRHSKHCPCFYFERKPRMSHHKNLPCEPKTFVKRKRFAVALQGTENNKKQVLLYSTN